MFNVSVINLESVVCIFPEGRLDTQSYESFCNVLQYHQDKEEYLIIDFTKCNYLSSSGIRLLLGASKKLSAKGGSLMLSFLPAEIFQVLEMAGLSTLLRIFGTTDKALGEILKLKNVTGRRIVTQQDGRAYILDRTGQGVQDVLVWQQPDLAGYNELTLASGTGCPAESLEPDPELMGHFFLVGHCAGFFPYKPSLSPEFRVVRDATQGVVYVNRAFSHPGNPGYRVRLERGGEIRLQELINVLPRLPYQQESMDIRAVIVADYSHTSPLFILLFYGMDNEMNGGAFVLNRMPDLQHDDSFSDFCYRALTIHNIEEVQSPDLSAVLYDPVIWLFFSRSWSNAAGHRVEVQTSDGTGLMSYERFLARKLYSDSVKINVKQLHGGYSAKTFQVESFDHHGRKLRPTVLKMAGRDMIAREAECCQKYALPYILNNSAMVLGTSFFCGKGALRYNFVGIGGEKTRLKWLTYYFDTWPVEMLEPLFDKIFLHILIPWYGQPVRDIIYPCKEHNPMYTFFPDLCESAGTELGIKAEDPVMTLPGIEEEMPNPYFVLKYVCKEKESMGIDYYTSVCHGDLNMQNILLDDEMNVYLIDFSETKPRSVVSDFARLEAIFMVESAPLEDERDLESMVRFLYRVYSGEGLLLPENVFWNGKGEVVMRRNIALISKMRQYAMASTRGIHDIRPYYFALLEWVLPVVCYSSVSVLHKRLSASLASILYNKLKLI